MFNHSLKIKGTECGAGNRVPEACLDEGPKCGKCLSTLLLVKSGQGIDPVAGAKDAMEEQIERII
nr:hypothetical protein [uncultured Desulfobacter sp.]